MRASHTQKIEIFWTPSSQIMCISDLKQNPRILRPSVAMPTRFFQGLSGRLSCEGRIKNPAKNHNEGSLITSCCRSNRVRDYREHRLRIRAREYRKLSKEAWEVSLFSLQGLPHSLPQVHTCGKECGSPCTFFATSTHVMMLYGWYSIKFTLQHVRQLLEFAHLTPKQVHHPSWSTHRLTCHSRRKILLCKQLILGNLRSARSRM